MSQKTLVDGTPHEILQGRTLVGGKAYDIFQGRTLINGNGQDILLRRKVIALYDWLYVEGGSGTEYPIQDRPIVHLYQTTSGGAPYKRLDANKASRYGSFIGHLYDYKTGEIEWDFYKDQTPQKTIEFVLGNRGNETFSCDPVGLTPADPIGGTEDLNVTVARSWGWILFIVPPNGIEITAHYGHGFPVTAATGLGNFDALDKLDKLPHEP